MSKLAFILENFSLTETVASDHTLDVTSIHDSHDRGIYLSTGQCLSQLFYVVPTPLLREPESASS